MKLCDSCGYKVPIDTKECPNCHQKGKFTRYICPNCGNTYRGRYCNKCGIKFDALPKVCPRCNTKFFSKACPKCGFLALDKRAESISMTHEGGTNTKKALIFGILGVIIPIPIFSILAIVYSVRDSKIYRNSRMVKAAMAVGISGLFVFLCYIISFIIVMVKL